jgi:hypothetical protein
MRRLMIPIIVLMLSLSAYGDEETLISGDIESGGYGGVEVKFADINGEWEVLVGGRGGWIINHQFVLGGAGYGLATRGEIRPRVIYPYYIDEFEMGYGGVLLGYISRSDKLIHLTIETLIGGGGITPYDQTFNGEFDSDAFFIVEPEVSFIANVSKLMRFGFGASYRITSGVEYLGLDDDDISGPAINLMVKFGKF